MGNPDRLGRSGPSGLEALPRKVESVNVSAEILWDVPAGDGWQEDDTGHQYYRNNPRVREDVLAVLNGTAGDRIPGRKRCEDERGFLLGNSPKSGVA